MLCIFDKTKQKFLSSLVEFLQFLEYQEFDLGSFNLRGSRQMVETAKNLQHKLLIDELGYTP